MKIRHAFKSWKYTSKGVYLSNFQYSMFSAPAFGCFDNGKIRVPSAVLQTIGYHFPKTEYVNKAEQKQYGGQGSTFLNVER